MIKKQDADIHFLELAVPEIEAYLLSEQLFWPLGSAERLTLASLLLAEKRAEAVKDTSAFRTRLYSLRESIKIQRNRWRTNWSNKATQEFGARLRQWDQVLLELFKEQQAQAIVYQHEVTLRVMLELLKDEMLEKPEAEISRLDSLDRRLMSLALPGEFIWEEELKDVFPSQPFWFLYIEINRKG